MPYVLVATNILYMFFECWRIIPLCFKFNIVPLIIINGTVKWIATTLFGTYVVISFHYYSYERETSCYVEANIVSKRDWWIAVILYIYIYILLRDREGRRRGGSCVVFICLVCMGLHRVGCPIEIGFISKPKCHIMSKRHVDGSRYGHMSHPLSFVSNKWIKV